MSERKENAKTITLIVNRLKEKRTVEVQESATICELKDVVAKKFNAQPSQLCLIFAGKIMKDQDTFETLNIKDGSTVYLVIKANAPQDSPKTALFINAESAQIPRPPAVIYLVDGYQERMQHELLKNRDGLENLDDGLMVQQIISNPGDILRQLILNNPQMQQLVEETMEMAQNPSMMQELLRTQDRALLNLESTPGGFSALQRMYRDFEEPFMDTIEEFSRNTFSTQSENGGEQNPQRGQENCDPLPNPWGGSTRTNHPYFYHLNSNETEIPTLGNLPTGRIEGTMLNSDTMNALIQQIIENPQVMQSITNTQNSQSTLQAMTSNPNMENLLSINQLFAYNPEIQSPFQNMMPTLSLSNPLVQDMSINPNMLSDQLQRGFEALSINMPNVSGNQSFFLLPNADTTSNADSTVTNDIPPTERQDDDFYELMRGMVSQVPNNINPVPTTQSPEEKYSSQLEQLSAMGFVNQNANLQALIATFGDINASIDQLLSIGELST